MENQLPSDTIVGSSKLELIKSAKFIWEINNFSICPEGTGDAIKSPNFEIVCPNGDVQKWRLIISPSGYAHGQCQYDTLFINIKMEESNKECVLAKGTISMQNAGGEETHKRETNVYKYKTGNSHNAYSVDRNFLFASQNALLPNDQLTFICHLGIFERKESLVQNGTTQIPSHCQSQLTEALRTLWETKPYAYTDCVLITSDNIEIKAHKLILSCRSPVFAAMFEHNETTEAHTNRVEITDIRAEVMDQMLHFIYTGAAPNLDAVASELFSAADKYQLDGLKLLSERSLALSLDNGNACELLVLADLYSADNLKSAAIQFIKSHADEIDSDAWKILCAEHSHLVLPVFEAMANRNGN